MPRKPIKGRRKNRRFRRRRKVGLFNDTVLYHAKKGTHSPLPAVYYTKFTACGTCYSGSGAGTGDLRLNIKMNSIYRPFASAVTGVTYSDITGATYNATGYSSLIGTTMYTTSLVYAAKIELDVIPYETEMIIAAVTASDAIDVPSSMGAALGKGMTKQQSFTAGRPGKSEYPLKFYVPCNKLIGVNRVIWMNDIGANFAGGVNTDPPVLLYFVCNIASVDNAQFGEPVGIRFRVTYYTKLRQLNYEALQN